MDEQLKRDAHLLCEKIRQLTLELDKNIENGAPWGAPWGPMGPTGPMGPRGIPLAPVYQYILLGCSEALVRVTPKNTAIYRTWCL